MVEIVAILLIVKFITIFIMTFSHGHLPQNHSPQVKMASEMSREVYQRIGEYEATKECLW